MKTIEATYRVTTPMFLGGADNEHAEFRLPSFKGALRFWWRALAWQRLDGDLQKIYDQEADLFGSASGGQAEFLLDVAGDFPEPLQKGTKLREKVESGKVVGPGARYLGYGVMHAFGSKRKKTEAGQLTRACLSPGFEFTVRLALKPRKNGTDADKALEIRNALICLGLFGGLGSKARKGYGSVSLRSIDGEPIAVTPQSFARTLLKVASDVGESTGEPAYTAWSDKLRVGAYLGPSKLNGLQLLDSIGRELIWFRSNGRVPRDGPDREVLGDPVDPETRRFWADHDLMAAVASRGEAVKSHPERVVFGLPHNYFFSSIRKGAGVEPVDHDRRASPLLLHVHHFDSHGPAVIVSFWPANFLPDDEKLSVGRSKVPVETADLWQPIEDFLDFLAEPRFDDHVFTQLR
ncbi:MAG: type III-B CRISPR module RAMP protein Cmr1 [Persicimonas sp.]